MSSRTGGLQMTEKELLIWQQLQYEQKLMRSRECFARKEGIAFFPDLSFSRKIHSWYECPPKEKISIGGIWNWKKNLQSRRRSKIKRLETSLIKDNRRIAKREWSDVDLKLRPHLSSELRVNHLLMQHHSQHASRQGFFSAPWSYYSMAFQGIVCRCSYTVNVSNKQIFQYWCFLLV